MTGPKRRDGPLSQGSQESQDLRERVRVHVFEVDLELWQHNISVNELIPGPVLTDRVAQHAREPGTVFQDDSEWVKTPEDVVPLALFLAIQPDKGPIGQTYSLMRRDT